MSWFFYFCKFTARSFFFLFTRLKVNGRDNVPNTRPLIVVANHITYAEPFLMGMLLPGRMRFAGKEKFFRNGISRMVVKGMGVFPVYQGVADRKTIRLMEQYVKEGFALVIFPEGTRSQSAELLPALHGTALIAQRTNALILPAGISGTEKMRGPLWFIRRPVITVNFGEPFNLPSDSVKISREDATKLIMARITDLLPAEYHGAYAGKDSS